jgi:carboxypeptidase Taq
LYSAQFFQAAKKQIPNLTDEIASGNLVVLRDWLNREVHWVGRMENAETIIQRVTGEPLNAHYFTDYLWQKYGEIFHIKRK